MGGAPHISVRDTVRVHSAFVYDIWTEVQDFIYGRETVNLNGKKLSIASLVAVVRHGCLPDLDRSPKVLGQIHESVSMLDEYLAKGYYAYGVNTGFGGSADSRTKDVFALQRSLVQMLQCGVLGVMDSSSQASKNQDLELLSMPIPWVKMAVSSLEHLLIPAKGTMLVRCNSLLRAHSAVSLKAIEAVMKLLRSECTPVIPLRGSISASGDLIPLAYVAGTLEGNPDLRVHVKTGKTSLIVNAKEALKLIGEEPLAFRPKEALGLINGTAPSAALASLVLYETHHIAILAQVLTAIAVEALQGNAESFNSFIAEVRPHQGQVQVAEDMRKFLEGSKLARRMIREEDERFRNGLHQDRYAIRTATQWIGPQLEDLMLAHQQVTVELNSTTDNPLVDAVKGDVYSGGNFQATSITSAMEKTRLSLQMLGKLLSAQCTELINPVFSNGLPANLAPDDPSLSFTMKGLDISMASYMSELAFLANPVSTHVQSAEMHNQSVNSLALISARYSMQCVELVSLMCASYLYVGCQALDLRVMHLGFLSLLRSTVRSITADVFRTSLSTVDIEDIQTILAKHIPEAWSLTSTLDAHERYIRVVDSCMMLLMKKLLFDPSRKPACSQNTFGVWRERLLSAVPEIYTAHRARFFAKQETAESLGHASKKMYLFVRKELGVPFHLGLVDQPSGHEGADNSAIGGRPKKTIGSWVSVIYESLRNGRLHRPLMGCLNETGDLWTTESVYNRDANERTNGMSKL